MKVLFKEEQSFKFIYKAAVVIFSLAIMSSIVWGTFKQLTSDIDFGNKPMSDEGVIYFSFFMILLLAAVIFLFIRAKLEVIITTSEIRYKYYPFIWNWKSLTKHNLKEAYVRKYKPLLEFGGWGYRSCFKNGKALNVYGNMGLQLIFNDDKKLLIGTQKPKELEVVIKGFLKPRGVEVVIKGFLKPRGVE